MKSRADRAPDGSSALRLQFASVAQIWPSPKRHLRGSPRLKAVVDHPRVEFLLAQFSFELGDGSAEGEGESVEEEAPSALGSEFPSTSDTRLMRP